MNAEKLTVTGKVALGLASACILGTLEVCRRTWNFIESERRAKVEEEKELRHSFDEKITAVKGELVEVRSEVAEVGDAVESQAITMDAIKVQSREQIDALARETALQLESLRQHMTTQLDFISKEQGRSREDSLRQETATATAFRELREDLRAATSARSESKGKDE